MPDHIGGALGVGRVGQAVLADPQRDSVGVCDVENLAQARRVDDLGGVGAFGGRATAGNDVDQRRELGIARDDGQAGNRDTAVGDHDALAVVVDAEVVGLSGEFGMDLVGGDHAVEVRIHLAPQDRIGEPPVVEVAEVCGGLLIAGVGRIPSAPGVHVQREADLRLRVESVDEVIGRRISRGLVEQADGHQVRADHGGREVGGERNRIVGRQHRIDGFIEHHPVIDLVAVLPRQIGRILLEFGHRRRRDPASAGLRRPAENLLDPGTGGVVDPQRKREVVDGHHRVESGRAHGRQLIAVVGDLLLVRQRIELLQHLDGDAIRNIHGLSRIGENSAPLDSRPEGVCTDTLAGKPGIGDVLQVAARAVFGHRTPPAEQ